MGTPTDRAAALERLAEWMGWEVRRLAHGTVFAVLPDDGRVFLHGPARGFLPAWDPFTDANAAESLVERLAAGAWVVETARYQDGYVAEAWRYNDRGHPDIATLHQEPGDTFREAVCALVLAVLDSTPTPTEPTP